MASIIICDICNSRDIVRTITYKTGTETDVAGGSREYTYDSYDLCLICENTILNKFVTNCIKNYSDDQFKITKELVRLIKEEIKK